MAIHAPITGAPARTLSNVVRLPTAAPRQVKQFHNKGTRAAKAALPRHPAEYLFAGQRKALRRAERLSKIARTPELMIAMALYAAMDEDTRRRVMLYMAPALASEGGTCRDAVEVLLTATMTVGERVDLDWAYDRLNGVR